MMNIIFLGLLIGLAASALRHSYSVRDIIGFSMLAIVGAWEGKLLAGFLQEYNSMPQQLTTSLFIIIGAASLVFLKVLFTPKTSLQ